MCGPFGSHCKQAHAQAHVQAHAIKGVRGIAARARARVDRGWLPANDVRVVRYTEAILLVDINMGGRVLEYESHLFVGFDWL